MRVTNYEISNHDLKSLHYVCYEALELDLNQDQLKVIFELLPETIRLAGFQWGLSDTVFKEDAFEWLQKNVELALKTVQKN